ncbi:putative serine protease K12H4.7 [Rhopalosiphum maidis]|uniref:putative serine protease K12H4.7 n=1 Tax=Rhopalosiphum maidis TaxID=43146 RepID=UPI000EFFAA9B|nr:putative serine protease K12H4.7 [Rhopalosiphum maidis]
MSLIFCLLLCCFWYGSSAYYSSFTSLVGIGAPTSGFIRARSIKMSLSQYNIDDNWIVQKLDHFNPNDKRMWKQRYYMNREHYKKGGPIFLLVGGEEKILLRWMTDGAMIEYAKIFNALCFQLEHRFYGKSRPTDNLNTTNLVYLTTQQALADIEVFIKNKTEGQFSNAKWVVFGGSYPGSLAAWSRMKFPHLVHAAVSSSSIIKTKIDNKEYFKVAQKALSAYNPKCSAHIREATIMISDLLKTKNGTEFIQKKFKTCNKINIHIKKDIRQLFQQLAVSFSAVIQYNRDNRYYENINQSFVTIITLCDIMLNKTLGNSLERYIAVHEKLRYATNRQCSSYSYKSSLASNAEISWNKGYVESGDRQWFYQLCTEIGNFITSHKDNHLFGNTIPLEFFTDLCTDVFGDSFDFNALEKAVEKTSMMYHDLRNKTSRIVYLHGSIDPWNGLGLTEPKANNSVSIFIEGVSHCADVYPSTPSDPPQLSKARETVVIYLKKWLEENGP